LTKCARCLGKGKTGHEKNPEYDDGAHGDEYGIGGGMYRRGGSKHFSQKGADLDGTAASTAKSDGDDLDLLEVGTDLINKDKYFEEDDFEYYRVRLRTHWKHKGNEETEINWQPGEYLGHGTFGTVILGLRDNGELMAVKQVILAGGSQNDRIKALEQEIDMLRSLSHKNIVKYVGTSRDRNHLNIFLEYIAGGTIAGLIKKYGKFQENLIRIYTKQILEGLEYLHAHNVIHRDIKGGNVLVDRNGVCKLADFGTAKRFLDDSEINNSLTGTANWMAPEVINQSGHGRKADIWSVGCTVVEMATAKPPFSQFKSQMAALLNIARSSEPPHLPSDISPELRDFILICFRRQPRERPNVRRLLAHPFIVGVALGSTPTPHYGLQEISEENEAMVTDPSPVKYKSHSFSRESLKKISNKEKKSETKSPKIVEEVKLIEEETTMSNSEVAEDNSLLAVSNQRSAIKSQDFRTRSGNMIVTVMELKNESMETEGIETEQSRLDKEGSAPKSSRSRKGMVDSEITETAQEEEDAEALQRFQSGSSYASNLTHMESVFRQGTVDIGHMTSLRSNTQELAHLDSQELGYYALQAPFGVRDFSRNLEVTKNDDDFTQEAADSARSDISRRNPIVNGKKNKKSTRTIKEVNDEEREKKMEEGANLLDSSSSDDDDDDDEEEESVQETQEKSNTSPKKTANDNKNNGAALFMGKEEGANLLDSSSDDSSYESSSTEEDEEEEEQKSDSSFGNLSARQRMTQGVPTERSCLYREVVHEEVEEELASVNMTTSLPKHHDFSPLSHQASECSHPIEFGNSLSKRKNSDGNGSLEGGLDDIRSVIDSESSRAIPTSESKHYLREILAKDGLGQGGRSSRDNTQGSFYSPDKFSPNLVRETEEHGKGEDSVYRLDSNFMVQKHSEEFRLESLKSGDNLIVPHLNSNDISASGSPAKNQVKSFISHDFSRGTGLASDSSFGETVTKDRVLAFESMNHSSDDDDYDKSNNNDDDDIEVISYGRRSKVKEERSRLLEGSDVCS